MSLRTFANALIAAGIAVLLLVLVLALPAAAATKLRQSTEIEVRVGPFLDVEDVLTPETGCDLSVADQAEVLKADGAATVDISGATMTAVSGADGWCDLTLTTGHTDTVGELVVVIQDASIYRPVFRYFQVVEESVYDAHYASGAAAPLETGLTLPGQEAPPAAPTLEEAIAWLYKNFRNKKTQTVDTWSLFSDGGDTVDAKAAVGDESGTTTKEEIVTGP